ncbi:MAG: type IV pilus assembly protein PilM [Actinobacteria bacterium]|nr:type IV pilus assembly protein PilM [Actinomycetota bacterium]
MALFAMRQEPIGLDIGKSSIVGVQLAVKSPAVTLLNVHEKGIPDGLVFEGEILDPEGFAVELKTFIKEARFKGKTVRMGVGNQKVIVRTIEVPEMDEEELRGAIEFQAQDYIPMPLEEVILDFQVVRRQVDAEGVVRQQVVLVAAQKDMVQQYLVAARKAGLTVEGIDVSAFALIRALSSPVSFVDQGAPPEAATGFLHMTSSTSTLVVAADGIPLFTRIVSLAYDNFINVLVEGQSMGADEALVLTELVGLPGPDDTVADDYNPDTVQAVHTTLNRVAEQFVGEMRRSLDYYQSQEYSLPVTRIIFSGRGPLLRNLDHRIADTLAVPVEVGNPLLRITENKSQMSDALVAGLSPRLAVAIGLSLDEVE